jgi:hypothetical protein
MNDKKLLLKPVLILIEKTAGPVQASAPRD